MNELRNSLGQTKMKSRAVIGFIKSPPGAITRIVLEILATRIRQHFQRKQTKHKKD